MLPASDKHLAWYHGQFRMALHWLMRTSLEVVQEMSLLPQCLAPLTSPWTLWPSPLCLTLSLFFTQFLPCALFFLMFCVFRQQVLGGGFPFPKPGGFSPVCFVLENFRPSAVFRFDGLLCHSARSVSVDQLCSGCCRWGSSRGQLPSFSSQLPDRITPPLPLASHVPRRVPEVRGEWSWLHLPGFLPYSCVSSSLPIPSLMRAPFLPCLYS